MQGGETSHHVSLYVGRVITRVPQGYLVEPDPEHQGKVIGRAGRERAKEREREKKPCVCVVTLCVSGDEVHACGCVWWKAALWGFC